MTPETPTRNLSVEFFPSADDYAYIAQRIASGMPSSPLVKYSYQTFLLINAVVFPAFLWFEGYLFAGTIVAALNIIFLSFVLPWVNSAGLKKYYEYAFGKRESRIAKVELSEEGVSYISGGGNLFLPWDGINSIDETDDAIYFFFDGNGIAVRKSGFAYRDEQVQFLAFARQWTADTKELNA